MFLFNKGTDVSGAIEMGKLQCPLRSFVLFVFPVKLTSSDDNSWYNIFTY